MMPFERLIEIVRRDEKSEFYQISHSYKDWHFQLKIVSNEKIVHCFFAKPTTIKPEIIVEFELTFDEILGMQEKEFFQRVDAEIEKMIEINELELTETIYLTARKVWDARNEGCHDWMEYKNKYITFEALSDANLKDYVVVALVDEIDAFGYPYSEYIDYIILDKFDFEGEDEK